MWAMIDLAGKIVTISEAWNDPSGGEDRYRIKGSVYAWTNKCFIDFKPIPSLLDLIGGIKREI